MSSRLPVTAEDENTILTLAARYGNDRRAICNGMGWDYAKLDNAIRRKLKDRYAAALDTYRAAVRASQEVQRSLKQTDIAEVLDMPARPFSVAVPTPKKFKPGKNPRAVIISDTQAPFHDPAVISVAESIIADVKPDYLLHGGDIIDAYPISDYSQDPRRKETLQDDIDTTRTLMHRWAQLAPQAVRVLLEGNHEDRLRRTIWSLNGAAREFAKLRVFQETMTWPVLLGLADIGWEFIESDKQSKTEVLPKLVTVHGHQVVKGTTIPGAAARRAVAKYGRSCVVSHIHKANTLLHRDHNGQAWGIETGCTCLLDGLGYTIDADWQNAITVIEWSQDFRLMEVQQVIVRDGSAMWRGREVAA